MTSSACLDPSGAVVTDPGTLRRIAALVIPPGWTDVWIAPDPLGHIQAAGVDSRGRTQYRYGGEKYAELGHRCGAATLLREHVTVTADGLRLDYIAKEGKHREVTVTVTDPCSATPVTAPGMRCTHGT